MSCLDAISRLAHQVTKTDKPSKKLSVACYPFKRPDLFSESTLFILADGRAASLSSAKINQIADYAPDVLPARRKKRVGHHRGSPRARQILSRFLDAR